VAIDSTHLDPAKLRKAADSFQVIWASISTAAVPAEDEEVAGALSSLGDALRRCGQSVQHVLESHGLPMATAVSAAPVTNTEPRPPLQANEVSRACTFVDRAADWLSDHADADVAEDELTSLQLIARLAFETRQTIAAALPAASAAGKPGETGSTTEEGSGPAAIAGNYPSPSETTLWSGELVLQDTPKDPLLVEWKDTLEVTPRAKELVDEFLAEVGLDLNPAARLKLNRSIEKWLVATPEGMVLVIRIGELQGRPEPYPRYVPKSAVADSEGD